jgi:CRP/FNR family transcriptional regulator, cyclic AMP receptor protein
MAAIASVRSALAQVSLLGELSSLELDELSVSLRRRRYRKGEVIVVQGEPGSTMYLIESGRVRIAATSAQGKEVILALRGPGEFFGEMALLDGEPRSADAIAHEASTLLLLERTDFKRYLEARPKLAIRMLVAISRRLRQSTRMVEDASFLDVPGRLARVLLDLADSQGKQTDQGIVITSRLTQSELASMVGATRESVNKWLGSFQRLGLVRRDGSLITITSLEKLRKRIY